MDLSGDHSKRTMTYLRSLLAAMLSNPALEEAEFEAVARRTCGGVFITRTAQR